MLYAKSPAGDIIPASKGQEGVCPGCGALLVAKCGEIVVHHWAHEASRDCDPWSEPETEWHKGWKEIVHRENTEVVIGPHRADIVGNGGRVVELQHSQISPAEIREREQFYGDMVWVFDGSVYDENFRRDANEPSSYRDVAIGSHRVVAFRWLWAAKSLRGCERPVYFDMGHGIMLHVLGIYWEDNLLTTYAEFDPPPHGFFRSVRKNPRLSNPAVWGLATGVVAKVILVSEFLAEHLSTVRRVVPSADLRSSTRWVSAFRRSIKRAVSDAQGDDTLTVWKRAYEQRAAKRRRLLDDLRRRVREMTSSLSLLSGEVNRKTKALAAVAGTPQNVMRDRAAPWRVQLEDVARKIEESVEHWEETARERIVKGNVQTPISIPEKFLKAVNLAQGIARGKCIEVNGGTIAVIKRAARAILKTGNERVFVIGSRSALRCLSVGVEWEDGRRKLRGIVVPPVAATPLLPFRPGTYYVVMDGDIEHDTRGVVPEVVSARPKAAASGFLASFKAAEEEAQAEHAVRTYMIAEGHGVPAAPLCPRCGAEMRQRFARGGDQFWGCSKYPRCRGTHPMRLYSPLDLFCLFEPD